MVPLTEMDKIVRRAKSDREMRGIYAFLFREAFVASDAANYPHAVLLQAVALGEKSTFLEQVTEIKRRRTSEGGGWYDNDSLIFLLLVGCERFEIGRGFLDGILAARDRNANPIPKRVNEVFRAIQRKEYGMEGQFSFIKIPFRELTGGLDLSNTDAEKAYTELARGEILEQLSPFLQLLGIRAFELVLFHRKPVKYENFDELVRGVESVKENASLRQVVSLMWALPYKWLLLVLLAVLPFFFGLGEKAFLLSHESSTARVRPATLGISGSTEGKGSPLTGVRALARDLMARQGTNTIAVAISTSRLTEASPKFSVELSLSTVDLLDGYAVLVRPGDGGPNEMILPVQKNRESLRAFVPATDPESYLIFELVVRSPTPRDAGQIASLATIRTLE